MIEREVEDLIDDFQKKRKNEYESIEFEKKRQNYLLQKKLDSKKCLKEKKQLCLLQKDE
jgi:hypothetical protein